MAQKVYLDLQLTFPPRLQVFGHKGRQAALVDCATVGDVVLLGGLARATAFNFDRHAIAFDQLAEVAANA
ncbi:hypothetical protein [Bythopirellula polymerisocia]|uniref:hypothetical protein n=1 Tax=Bythopirellula polymerisocia TaxID=2528003 RepID=UPI0011B7E094|nr:hypothetical protein [Bythopirellula polymerisocia]